MDSKIDLMDLLYEELVKKHGKNNVSWDSPEFITVIDNGEEHKVWVETK